MKKQSLLFSLSCLALGNLIFSNSIAAQVTTDGTTNTTVNSDNNGNFTIEQGDRAGSNLFHSFGDFSVPTDGSAFFNNATDISNIFSRVTGGNISNIDGLIGANGSANLFIINPAGILFGNNARLDIGGSFFGTTADSILFEDGEFSATNLDNPPLLTINAPIGLNFRDNPAPIENSSTASADFTSEPSFDDNLFGIRVPDGKTFALAGGDITADSGRIVAVGGRIELGAVGEAGTLGINFEGDNISFSFPNDLARANVSLVNNAGFLVSGSGGGDIAITANNINILEGSGLFGGIFSGLGSPDAQAGDINLQASESISIDGITEDNDFSEVSNEVETDSSGNAGTLSITATNFSVTNGALVSTSTFGQGNGGDIFVNASESVLIDGASTFTGIFSQVRGAIVNGGNIDIKAKSILLNGNARINNDIFGEGNAGNIVLNTDSLNISQGNITSSVFGQGNAGNINVNASESVQINGEILNDAGEAIAPGGILNQVERNGEGQGGDLVVETPLLNVSNGGKVQVATFGDGNPGNLSIRSSEINVFNTEDSNNQFSTGIFAGILLDPRNEQFASGETTSLTIETETLSVRGGAEVSAETSGIGNGSNIFINATELVEVVGTDNKDGSPSIISAEVNPLDLNTSIDLETITRNGGNITINTSQLNLRDGGVISTDTSGIGNSGNITINATQDISLDNSSIFSEVNNDAIGDAGTTTIITDRISLSNESVIGGRVFGEGQGGNINLGSEQFSIKELNVTDGSQISVSVFGEGNAGELSIFSNNIEVDGLLTGLFASVEENATGQGGNIFVETDSLALTNGGRVAANVESMGQGDAGTLEISASDSIVINGTTSEGAPSAITSVVNRDESGEGIGNGGDVTVSTGSLFLIDGGRVSATSLGQGNGGDLTIDASESIFISGVAERFRSGISVDALVNDGNSGNANITTDRLTIENGGTVEASNIDTLGVFASGTGEPGNISIQANSIMLNNGGRIDAATQSETGEGANINLQVDDTIRLENNSFISAQAFGNANGGNLTIDTDFIIAFSGNNDIIANAEQGRGGVITINAESLLGIEERLLNDTTNDINASSEDSTLDGDIFINTSDVNPAQGTTELPTNPVEPEQTVAQACEGNTGVASTLRVKGRGGVPTVPDAPLSSETITVGGESEASTTNITTIATENGNITLARGVIKTADGQIILTPTPVNGSASRTANGSPNCS